MPRAAAAHHAAWTFGELPPVVTRRVGGLEVRSYPALVDRGAAVDLVLLETAAAAEAATRTGVRRLLMLAARGHVAVSAARMPPPFPSLDGAPPARGQADAFRALVLARSVDDAFKLAPGAPLPRTKEAFEALVREGSPRIERAARDWTEAVKATSSELAATLAALKAASKGPSGAAAVRDIRSQLGHLFPANLTTHGQGPCEARRADQSLTVAPLSRRASHRGCLPVPPVR
ncbi:DUF3418 domain-containing protein [Archangium violaceum]|uniref:DUF3418 domain-containing protein n=1 Tax=Archangium violaceum TaxID=83451 RepID=UPI0037C14C1B